MNGDLRIGDWLVQPALNSISRNGTSRTLEPKVMEVLVCLAQHPGETLPKEQLLSTVWADTFVSDDVLVRSISEIRRAFDDDARESRFIQTVPKRGYRLVVPVQPVIAHPGLATGVSQAADGARQSIFAKPGWRLGIATGTVATVALLILLALAPTNIWRKIAGKTDVPQIRSIAVLPLQNLSGDPTQEYFADAMTEELITELSRIRALKVISRTSVMRYKKTDKPLPEIARELGVDGVVEGSVLRSGDRVRITAQLIHAAKDTNVWAQTYDRNLRDVLSLQSTVADTIAKEINLELTPQEQSQLQNVRPVNRKALDAYLDGQRYLGDSSHLAYSKTGWPKPSEAAFRKAVTCFEQSIREDPNYSPAYVGLSQAWESPWLPGIADLEKAEVAALKAVELDGGSAQAHLQLAHMLILYDRDWAAAGKEFARVLEITPSSAPGHADYAGYLEALGQREQALHEYEWAQQLDPSEVHLPDSSLSPSERVEQGRRYMATHPVYPIDNWLLARSLYQAGRYKEAVDNWLVAFDHYGWTEEAKRIRRAYSPTDPTRAVRQLSREIEDTAKDHWLQPSFMIEFYTAVDDREHVLAWLEKGFAQREWDTVFSLGDSQYAGLRSDLRFQDLLRRAGLPQ
jgi:TolB-like protein/DNA-binding winged helix-turn-helix (wHTH) protein